MKVLHGCPGFRGVVFAANQGLNLSIRNLIEIRSWVVGAVHAAPVVPGHACLSAQDAAMHLQISSTNSCFLNSGRAAPASCIFQLYFDCGLVIGVILQESIGCHLGHAEQLLQADQLHFFELRSKHVFTSNIRSWTALL